MANFAADSAVEGADGRYRAVLHPAWDVWGPFGGYRAAVVMRAIGAESRLPRPATFTCTFVGPAVSGPVEIEVTRRPAGKRAENFHAVMTQGGTPVIDAIAWVVSDTMEGFEHNVAVMPDVPPPEALRGYHELADNYDEWYPFWRSVHAKPLVWNQDKGPPIYQAWLRFVDGVPPGDAFLDAARLIMWLDVMMWNAVPPPHGWPTRWIAPSLDLTAQFHCLDTTDEWLLCDAAAPVAGGGLASCNGRVWAADGRLLASGTSQLICKPNPEYGAAGG
jgi:acyl-CoA thioesterase-2